MQLGPNADSAGLGGRVVTSFKKMRNFGADRRDPSFQFPSRLSQSPLAWTQPCPPFAFVNDLLRRCCHMALVQNNVFLKMIWQSCWNFESVTRQPKLVVLILDNQPSC